MSKYFIISIALLIAISGCSDHPADAPKPKQNVHGPKGVFQSKTFGVSENEHVVVFDVPDYGMPDRCVVYVNEKLGTSQMHCQSDESESLPITGPTLND